MPVFLNRHRVEILHCGFRSVASHFAACTVFVAVCQIKSFACSSAYFALTTISVACCITASDKALRESSLAMARAIITAPHLGNRCRLQDPLYIPRPAFGVPTAKAALGHNQSVSNSAARSLIGLLHSETRHSAKANNSAKRKHTR